MTGCKLKQEIKQALTEGEQVWSQEAELDLTVERVYVLMDRERVKAALEHKTFEEQRHHAGHETDHHRKT